jgi:DNA-binding Lrp family transcriptional regulator
MSNHTEEFKVSGKELVERIKGLVKEGNIRRITIKNKDGKHIMELPLTFGVVGAVLAPMLAAVGAAAALLTECTIVVEREDKK